VLTEEAHGQTFAVPQGTMIVIKLYDLYEWTVTPLQPNRSGKVPSVSLALGCHGQTTASFVAQQSVVFDTMASNGNARADYRVTIVVGSGGS
jgi:hypothetical protein